MVARATDLCSFAVGEAEGGLVQLGVVDTSSATATAHLHPQSETCTASWPSVGHHKPGTTGWETLFSSGTVT